MSCDHLPLLSLRILSAFNITDVSDLHEKMEIEKRQTKVGSLTWETRIKIKAGKTFLSQALYFLRVVCYTILSLSIISINIP